MMISVMAYGWTEYSANRQTSTPETRHGRSTTVTTTQEAINQLQSNRLADMIATARRRRAVYAVLQSAGEDPVTEASVRERCFRDLVVTSA